MIDFEGFAQIINFDHFFGCQTAHFVRYQLSIKERTCNIPRVGIFQVNAGVTEYLLNENRRLKGFFREKKSELITI